MTILVAVADDSVSESVLDTAVALGEGMGEELYVVHLINEETADSAAKEMRDDLSASLEAAATPATVGLEHIGRSATRTGSRIGEELLELAASVDVTHIVMGHRSKGITGRLREGDAAFAVIDGARVPVTVVPEHCEQVPEQ